MRHIKNSADKMAEEDPPADEAMFFLGGVMVEIAALAAAGLNPGASEEIGDVAIRGVANLNGIARRLLDGEDLNEEDVVRLAGEGIPGWSQ